MIIPSIIPSLHTAEDISELFLSYSPVDMKGKYQLDRMRQLMMILDNPQESFKTIHIAGTSGKTSTAYFIRGFLEAAGQKTGLTVSPHITTITERVQIAGAPLADVIFVDYAKRLLARIAKTDLQPTYFELLIALAYWTFAHEQVDYAVVETGLGGLLDGTNVIQRPDKVCVITDIGLDHTHILGDTLQAIARQKAGIIQPHNHVLVRAQTSEVMAVFRLVAQKQQATFQAVTDETAPNLLPDFQHRNWALAKAAYEYVKNRDGLSVLDASDERTVAEQTPPGRWEIYNYKDKAIILDGAHNPQKMQALAMSLAAADISSVAVLANFLAAPWDKVSPALAYLQPYAHHLIIPEFQVGQDSKGRHSLTAKDLAHYAGQQHFVSIEAQPDLATALAALLRRPEKTLLVTGSLYLVSAVRPIMQQIAADFSCLC